MDFGPGSTAGPAGPRHGATHLGDQRKRNANSPVDRVPLRRNPAVALGPSSSGELQAVIPAAAASSTLTSLPAPACCGIRHEFGQ